MGEVRAGRFNPEVFLNCLQNCNLMLTHKPSSTVFSMPKAYKAEASCNQVVIEMLFYLLEALDTLSHD